MKKTLILKVIAIVLLVTLVISIILNNSNEHVDQIEVMLNNTKVIKVYNYQTKELVKKYDENSSKNIITKLNYTKWRESNSLNGDELEYTLKLYDNEDSDDVGTISIYKSKDYVLVTVHDHIENKVYKVNTDIKNLFDEEKHE